MLPDHDFWQGRHVLLTGHSGFKGGWLAIWLSRLGAKVSGLSLAPNTQPNLFDAADIAKLTTSHRCDIRDVAALRRIVAATKPEIVFHLAAQPLVRESYKRPVETFDTNVMGTAHLLDALRQQDSFAVGVIVTSDKAYRNAERLEPYREDDHLGGHDPYSASKAAAEIVVASYQSAFLVDQGKALATARAGNVIGGGDWSDDRLIPDAVRAWQAGETLSIRRPKAVRPWQHVLEPLCGYLRLAEKLFEDRRFASAYNFGPDADEAASVQHVIELARVAYGMGEVKIEDDGGPHEAGLLSLDASKARLQLGVTPSWTLAEAVTKTMQWYRRYDAGDAAATLCNIDIDCYEQVVGHRV